MNKVILKGRLTRDPDVRYTSSAEPICIARFALACEDRERTKNEAGNYPVNFIPCVAIGKAGEIVTANFCKAKEVLICGKMQSGNYINKEGKKVYTLECFVQDIEYCGKKENSNMTYDDSFMNIPDGFEGLPFK